MDLLQKYNTILNKYEINTPLRRAHFMAQIEHESNLKPISENLNYSSDGLLKIFKKYFTKETALLYHRKPEKIANKVYSSRMGNGDELSGDGWKYRGRGFIQVTGRNNYSALNKDTGLDVINQPDLLLEEPNALISALWFWKKNNINRLADKDDIMAVSKAINGGFIGLEHRKSLLIKWKRLT
jgi:putative chitinase